MKKDADVFKYNNPLFKIRHYFLAVFIFYLLYLVFYIKFSLRMKSKYNIDEIRNEINEQTTIAFRNAYLTRNYIVSGNKGNIFIGRYSELIWIFTSILNDGSGYEISRGINGYVRDVKKFNVFLENYQQNT